MMSKLMIQSEELPSSSSIPGTSPLEVSIVIPCLNESETLGTCIEKAQLALHQHEILGEVIVADNGSTDGSQIIASRKGARVVQVEAKGYGNVLMGGIDVRNNSSICAARC
jgi:glycosyltransferase involved in cell wall biosynthesis